MEKCFNKSEGHLLLPVSAGTGVVVGLSKLYLKGHKECPRSGPKKFMTFTVLLGLEIHCIKHNDFVIGRRTFLEERKWIYFEQNVVFESPFQCEKRCICYFVTCVRK